MDRSARFVGIDMLTRVANALRRHLILSFPEKVPAELEDALPVA